VVDTGREFGGMFGRGLYAGGGLYAQTRGSGIQAPPSRSPITNPMF